MDSIQQQHRRLTRRFFAQLLAGGCATALVPGCGNLSSPAFAEAVSTLPYLTAQEMFGTVERGRPLPYKLPKKELAEAGLTPETWKLEIIPDPDDPAEVDQALSVVAGTAFTYADGVLPAQRPGTYQLRCRSIDRNGAPQPWPRTLQNSGRNRLHHIPITVT